MTPPGVAGAARAARGGTSRMPNRSRLGRLIRRVRRGPPIVVVSGLPRSGTSMAMRMLEAGGMALHVDGVREADVDNPRGYFELERVKDLERDADRGWLREARGRAIKVVSFLLFSLPLEHDYRVLFMRRDLREVLASQAKMLAHRGERHEQDDASMEARYREHLEKVDFILRRRPCFESLYVDHRGVIEDPEREARRIAAFVGQPLDVESMASAVDPTLYRNRA